MILSYFGFIFAFALSHHWQNCDYSRTNKAIFKLVWNFQETCNMFFFLVKFFSWGELILPTPWRLGFKFEVKPGKSKKSESWCILKFKMWSRNILENMLRKNCYLKSVTLDLSFISLTLAYEGYIPYRGKKSRWKFSLGKNFVREKISHFSQTNFSNSSLFSDQFLKLKGLSWVELLFF